MIAVKTKSANLILGFMQQFYQLLLFLDRKYLSNPFVPSCATVEFVGNLEVSLVNENTVIEIVELTDCIVDLKSGLYFFDKRTPVLASSSWPMSHLVESRNPLPFFAIEIPEVTDANLMVIPSTGYYHWLLEDLPPIIHFLRSKKNLKLVCFEKAPNYVRDFARLFDIELIEAPRFVKLKRSQIGVPRPISGAPSEVNVNLLGAISQAVSSDVKVFKKVYISRENSRRSPNFESDLVEILSRQDWKILYLENISFTDQVRYFQNAEFIAGVHGAGLSGIVWAKPDAKIFEICPSDRNIECFLEIAKIKEQDIVRIIVNANDIQVPYEILECLGISRG